MKTFVIDHLAPETTAMLQALYSRSPKSVIDHLAKVSEVGASNFMESYYVGYGHKSIGDCGTTTIFIEGVSLLAAKAIQSHPLYNGQEASTRYIDAAEWGCVHPGGLVKRHLQDRWVDLYSEVHAAMSQHYRQKFPRIDGESEAVYAKAIKAKAFDVARGFLPCGLRTNLSWHTNLRQAWDHLSALRLHPLDEVRSIAAKVLNELKEKYPASFGYKEYFKSAEFMDRTFWENVPPMPVYGTPPPFRVGLDLFAVYKCRNSRMLYVNRPPKTALPPATDMFGRLEFEFDLDYGSYRDLQRHRSCSIQAPLVAPKLFHDWYLQEVRQSPAGARLVASCEGLMAETKAQSSEASKLEDQYFFPLGSVVPIKMQCSLNSAVYIAELRSSQSVHPTLRAVAQKMAGFLEDWFPGLEVHADMSEDEWSLRRGLQDITSKD